MSTEIPKPAAEIHRRVRQVGTVKSIAGAKSVVVQVNRRTGHGRYGKIVAQSSKFMAHDEAGSCTLGDVVEIAACRPLSARKRWRVSRIVKRGAQLAAELEG